MYRRERDICSYKLFLCVPLTINISFINYYPLIIFLHQFITRIYVIMETYVLKFIQIRDMPFL